MAGPRPEAAESRLPQQPGAEGLQGAVLAMTVGIDQAAILRMPGRGFPECNHVDILYK